MQLVLTILYRLINTPNFQCKLLPAPYLCFPEHYTRVMNSNGHELDILYFYVD